MPPPPSVSYWSIRDAGGLERHAAARQQLGEPTHNVAFRLHERDAVDGLRRLRIPEVGVQRRFPARLDEQRAVGALESRQIGDVDAVRDEQRLDQSVRKPGETAHDRCSPSHASAA